MRPYEVMVIFDVDLEEGDIRQHVDRALDVVKNRGGTPGSVKYWGRRTFAYEVKHRTEGYYVVIEATAEPEVLAEVSRMLVLEDAVLRHKVIRQPEKVVGRPKRRSAPAPAPAAEPAAS